MFNVVVLLACVAAVTCNDIKVGSENGRKVFDEKIEASPAIWRQVQKITINCSDSEVISHVVVTDNRAEKDGDAQIVEGGEGQKNVTIELKSPTAFRGFDFHVVVYAVQGTVALPPALIGKDIDVNNMPANEDSVDSVNITDAKPTVSTDVDRETSAVKGDQDQSTVDPIVKNLNEKTTEVPAGTPEVSINAEATTDKNALVASVPVVEDNATAKDDKMGPKDIPQKQENVKIEEDMSTITTYTTDDITDKATAKPADLKHETQQDFDSISKELGQKIIFGIKHQ